jgi:hypothetical protein
MDIPLSAALSPEALRARVREVLRRHWTPPQRAEPFAPPDKGGVEVVARAALDTMLTRQFRVGPLPAPDLYDKLLAPVRRFVARGKPIKVTVGFGPLKNPNVVSQSRADWAEFFALNHLVSWHNKVQCVYPPGLQLRVYFDDETLRIANGADRRQMSCYISSVAELIPILGYQDVFLPPTRLTHFMWFLRFGPYQAFRFCLLQIAEWRLRRWERDPANRGQLERMAEYARRNVVLPAGLSAEEQECFVRDASHRFRVCWDALRLGARIFPDRNRLMALYLDGSQHHRRQVALHLTSVDKGQMTQPWQGEGVLLDNGHGRLEPFVLTRGRRPHYQARTVDGLGLAIRPDFESIAVVWPRPAAPTQDTPPGAVTARISAP